MLSVYDCGAAEMQTSLESAKFLEGQHNSAFNGLVTATIRKERFCRTQVECTVMGVGKCSTRVLKTNCSRLLRTNSIEYRRIIKSLLVNFRDEESVHMKTVQRILSSLHS
jgi:hypothetical protein